MLKTIFGTSLLLVALASVITGRVATFHLTEGEAFVAGWAYWLVSFGCALVGYYGVKDYLETK